VSGASRQDEDCSVEEASTEQLTEHDNTTTGYDKGHNADKFEVVYTNADGLQNKLNELKVLVNSEIFKPKVFAVTEIKHKSKWNLQNSELNIEGYVLYTNDLAEKRRGVAMYIRDDLYRNQLYVDSVYKDFVLLQLKLSWWRGTVVERRSLAGELSLSCARPAADG